VTVKNQPWKCALMRLILSPGAFMVWHALGNPEEWRRDGSFVMLHTPTNIRFLYPWPDNSWEKFLNRVMVGFMFDGTEEYEGSIGYFDRHILHARACRVELYLTSDQRLSRRNHALFVTMTQLSKEKP
jgi:hypothetical protein